MKKVAFELAFDSVAINKKAVAKRGSATHGATVDLIWPRVGTARKTATSALELKDGAANCATLPWSERIIFKETVEGSFAIKVGFTRAMIPDEIEAFLRYVGSAAADTVAGIAAADKSVMGTAVAIPAQFLKKQLSKSAAYSPIAEGAVDLDAAALAGSRKISVPLVAARDISAEKRRTAGKTSSTVKAVVFKKGAAVGEAVLSLKVL